MQCVGGDEVEVNIAQSLVVMAHQSFADLQLRIG